MNKSILVVTACPAGVAHTYMVAEKLKNAIEAKGYIAEVETQGAIGIENKLTMEDIDNCFGVIFAAEVGVIDEERFEKAPVLECSMQEALKDSNAIVQELIDALK